MRTEKSNLTFVLNAVGVEPSFSLSYEGHVMDFGYCLANDKSEKVIEVWKLKYSIVKNIKINKTLVSCLESNHMSNQANMSREFFSSK